ncbi:MAG: hypothetical protein CJBNEKGG_02090 [Prosthecobacter sp.]|nr:hypothetical protein [Prosthecobacter sp.]
MEPLRYKEAPTQASPLASSPGHAPQPPLKDIEESLEDPFSLRFFPEDQGTWTEPRYYNLGKSLHGRAVFSVFWTDGKKHRVVFARDMTTSENLFFERKKAELA